MRLIAAFRVSHVYDRIVQPPQQVYAQFSISEPVVVPTDGRAVEYRLAPSEVESMIFDIATALRFAPNWHCLIVSTYKGCVTPLLPGFSYVCTRSHQVAVLAAADDEDDRKYHHEDADANDAARDNRHEQRRLFHRHARLR